MTRPTHHTEACLFSLSFVTSITRRRVFEVGHLTYEVTRASGNMEILCILNNMSNFAVAEV